MSLSVAHHCTFEIAYDSHVNKADVDRVFPSLLSNDGFRFVKYIREEGKNQWQKRVMKRRNLSLVVRENLWTDSAFSCNHAFVYHRVCDTISNGPQVNAICLCLRVCMVPCRHEGKVETTRFDHLFASFI